MSASPELRPESGYETVPLTPQTACELLSTQRNLLEAQRREIAYLKRLIEDQNLEIQSLQQQIQAQRPPFPCPLTTCDLGFTRPDNLSRHIKNQTDRAHQHIAIVMMDKHCQVCQRLLSRQCDFWRHMRSKHPDCDLLSWNCERRLNITHV